MFRRIKNYFFKPKPALYFYVVQRSATQKYSGVASEVIDSLDAARFLERQILQTVAKAILEQGDYTTITAPTEEKLMRVLKLITLSKID